MMSDATRIHRQTEARLHAMARRHFSRFPGAYHIDLRHLAALGGGSMEAGEALLHKMFKMAGPRAVHADALRELGNGSVTAGRKVIERFLGRLHNEHGANDEPEAEHQIIPQPDGNHGRVYARGGAVKASKADVNFRQAEDNQFCARCTMFREPASCTAVEGRIHRVDLCDLYEEA
jgi:hypothetical protein